MANFYSPTAPTTSKEVEERFELEADEFSRKALYRLRKYGSKKRIAFGESLVGMASPLLASNRCARRELASAIWRRLRKVWRRDPTLEFRMVTVIFEDFMASDETTVIDIEALIQRSRRALCKMSNDFIALVEMQAANNISHGDGGKVVCPHVHAVIFGHDLTDRALVVAERENARLGKLSNGLDPFDVTEPAKDKAGLRRMIFYPLKLPSKNKTLYINATTGKANLHEGTKNDRMIRYERMLEILSQLPLRSLIFAGGLGRPIKTKSLREVQQRNRHSAVKLTLESIRKGWRRWRRKSKTDRFRPPILKTWKSKSTC